MQTLNWTYRFLNANTCILGNRKNAGKTTFMNFALSQLRKHTKPAFCSIGIDGESNDLIDGRDKPAILTLPGDCVVTSLSMIKKSSAQFKVLKVLPIRTVLGQLVISETIRQGNIELVGPENNNQLNSIIRFLNNDLSFNTVIIDGAASRISPVSAINNCKFYYVVNIDRKNQNKAFDTLKLISLASSFSIAKEANKKEAYIIDGALTTSKLNKLPQNCHSIIVKNIASIFLSYADLKKVMSRTQVFLEEQYELNAFIVILKDVETKDFKSLYQQHNINTELITNPYVN